MNLSKINSIKYPDSEYFSLKKMEMLYYTCIVMSLVPFKNTLEDGTSIKMNWNDYGSEI